MPGKLRSKRIGPFQVTNVFPYGAVEIQDINSNKVFKVNGYRLKPFYEGFAKHVVQEVQLYRGSHCPCLEPLLMRTDLQSCSIQKRVRLNEYVSVSPHHRLYLPQ